MKITLSQLKRIIKEEIEALPQSSSMMRASGGDPEGMIIRNEIEKKADKMGVDREEVANQVLDSLVSALPRGKELLKLSMAVRLEKASLARQRPGDRTYDQTLNSIKMLSTAQPGSFDEALQQIIDITRENRSRRMRNRLI